MTLELLKIISIGEFENIQKMDVKEGKQLTRRTSDIFQRQVNEAFKHAKAALQGIHQRRILGRGFRPIESY